MTTDTALFADAGIAVFIKLALTNMAANALSIVTMLLTTAIFALLW